MMTNSEMLTLMCGLIGVLGSLNAWFIHRLVRKIDKVDGVASSVKIMQQDMKHIHEKLSELSDIYQRIVSLEKQVAILEWVSKERKPER